MFRKSFAAVFGLLLAAVAACGGGSSSSQSGASPSNVETVRVSVASFGSQRFPLDVMEMKGLDKKYGIQLERVPFSGPPANVQQLAGDVSDIAPATWLDLQQNLALGIRLIGVGPLLRYTNPMVVRADSSIKSVTDLKGKYIGVYSTATTDVLAVRAAIQQKYGFDYFKANTVQQADAPLLTTQLESGQLDAIFTFSNVGSQLVSSGKGRVLFVASDLLTSTFGLTNDDPFGIYMTSENVAKNHPERVKRYMSAYKEAVHILLTDDAIWTELAKTQNISDPQGIAALRDAERQSFTTTWNQTVINHMSNIFGIMLQLAGQKEVGLAKFDSSVYSTQFYSS
jgi:NitT/TauT family transport system substrate-binding protein